MPDAGVVANINVPVLDIDAWSATLSQWAGSPLAAGGGASGGAALSPTTSAYLPTSLAVRLAEEHGITLVGFARRGSLNVYSHPARVTG